MNEFLIKIQSHWSIYIICTLSSLLLCMSVIPRVIYISKKKKLFDSPDFSRKIHKEVIPNLGGIGVFLGFIVCSSIFINPSRYHSWGYLVAATLILFITGIKDDLINVNPTKKLIAQICSSLIIVLLADIRLTDFHGFLGIYQLHYAFSFFITVIGITFISNAFNLIDGIDGLAASVSILCTLFLGIAFASVSAYSLAIISFTLMGATIGFFKFNLSPARIFMGDCGSLVIGFIIAVLSIELTNAVIHFEGNFIFHSAKSVLVGTISLLFIPIFDTFRVFFVRILKGNSPFKADRTHVHHYLLDLGLSHSQTVLVLILSNLIIIGTAFLIQDYSVTFCMISILFIGILMISLLIILRKLKLSSKSQSILENKTTSTIH